MSTKLSQTDTTPTRVMESETLTKITNHVPVATIALNLVSQRLPCMFAGSKVDTKIGNGRFSIGAHLERHEELVFFRHTQAALYCRPAFNALHPCIQIREFLQGDICKYQSIVMSQVVCCSKVLSENDEDLKSYMG